MSVVRIKKPTVARKPLRRIGDAVFKMIVEMAYEMKYANRHCEAERTNLFHNFPPIWFTHHKEQNHDPPPFDTKEVVYKNLRLGDIVVHNVYTLQNDTIIRLAKVTRINQKSISTKDCDQDGQLVEYNPEDNEYYPTKEHRKDYNKVFPYVGRIMTILTGTKHLRYDGWNA
jgi:hypothetical protein